ncbi:cytidylate kinase [Methanomicrobiaceae archaeon CYW5]|uniref:(d)CMP kinase n=1 Tax=Methanovulcanius yangii TaxID=1789227 RepID=UPI0029CA34A3|nr:AAA family ATPase [Methanovulcanius yangii]MBT8508005.1 cytidylate kinase [Methanovulcanius yangii]
MRITISGPPGSGTTSLAKYLVARHGYALISAGEVFRTLAAEHEMDLASFGTLAEKDDSVDRMIDSRQKEIGEARDDIIIEGRLAGHMIDNADIRIWIMASVECRSIRISDREGLDAQTAAELTIEREECEAGRYLNYYGIDIGDLNIYDLVINSEVWGIEETGAIVDAAIAGIR